MVDPYELPRLLARLKLQVRRLLNQSVDLEKLSRDPEYARQRLAEIEELAGDEELLVLVLRLRDLLCPLPAVEPQADAMPEPPGPVSQGPSRDYRFGARAW
ncbi:hypothetical protein [Azovibrio restrictus]|jgi:hypothetical protein|uniref:hypothetical protein n=1 Tax=Azovibrio restrictus TaxID=146938 RepID=UPI0026F25190|nr:hypothetical protein [Azovibrio restrictus]